MGAVRDIFRRDFEAASASAASLRLKALHRALEKLQCHKSDPVPYIEAARCYQAMHNPDDALNVLRNGVATCLPSAALYMQLIDALEKTNCTSEGLQIAKSARLAFPDDFGFRLKESLLLPALYSSVGDIEFWRQRFTDGLRDISGDLRSATDPAGVALAGLSHHVNFLLAYQGKDDIELQKLYGQLAHHIAGSSNPDFVRLPAMPVDEGRLRIGYVSACYHHHSVAKSHLGWLRHHRRERFHITAYSVGRKADGWTRNTQDASDAFRQMPDDFLESCRLIRMDQPHILVFLDIGMTPRMMELAALRLAPVQCASWGHPVTSGLPTIDYFLSSDLMEPDNADEHYSERLVRLPGIGISYRRPSIPWGCFYKTREDFGIRNEAIVYLSCQSTSKYLPQHDDIYPAIAKQVPCAQFVFAAANPHLGEIFRQRLVRAFQAAGVPVEDRIVIVAPELDIFSYWSLNVLADVFLDTLEWSGCNSTLEAIACKLPVVTMPGRFLRGRHSYAILKQLGATRTIAGNKSQYIEIAARIGLDDQWRNDVVQRQIAGIPKLFSDTTCVEALEKFYEQVVMARSADAGSGPIYL